MYERSISLGQVLLLAVLSSCTGGEIDRGTAGSPCPLPTPQPIDSGAEVTIGDMDPPCHLEFSETGIVLRSDPNGEHPDPGHLILQNSRGHYYSAGARGFQSTVSVWDGDGSYITSFGTAGDGPGEISTYGIQSLFLDQRDRIHVLDLSDRWSLFGTDHTFLGSVSMDQIGGFGQTALIGNGRILTSPTIYSQATSHYFHIADSTGAIVSRFAPVDPQVIADGQIASRKIAYTGGSSFWASPLIVSPGYSPSGYVLEEWSLQGELMRTLRRDVPWHPIAWPPPPPSPSGIDLPYRPTHVSDLHLDDRGILLVAIVSQSESWRPMTFEAYGQLTPEERISMYDVRLEAIDTASGTLLVSQILENGRLRSGGIVPGTNTAFEIEVGEDLLPMARMLEYLLVTR